MKNKFYTEEEILFLRENLKKFGAKVCSEKIGRSVNSINGKSFKEFGFTKRSCEATDDEIKKLKFIKKEKELVIDFDKTKTPKELSYFLGFFWADGYIRRDGSLVIEITQDDADSIEHIFDNLASFKIYQRERAGRKTQKTFFYGRNDEITEKLKNMGKYPKSVESHEKILDFIPNEYKIYFIRGLIDGDGSFYFTKTNGTQFVISGRYEQNWGSLIEYFKTIGIGCKICRREFKKNKYSYIRCTNTTQLKNFLSLLYEDKDGIWLDRKYNKLVEHKII